MCILLWDVEAGITPKSILLKGDCKTTLDRAECEGHMKHVCQALIHVARESPCCREGLLYSLTARTPREALIVACGV